jgi:hypothetical protein
MDSKCQKNLYACKYAENVEDMCEDCLKQASREKCELCYKLYEVDDSTLSYVPLCADKFNTICNTCYQRVVEFIG